MTRKPAGYVVYFCEHLRDGIEEGARAFDNLPDAIAFLDNARNEWFARSNYTFKLFTLGEEIPLEEEKVEVPQPSKETVKFKVKKGA